MTTPSRNLTPEEVLDEFFFSTDKPSSATVLRACESYPEYRENILEFAALWTAYEAAPEPAPSTVSEESVSRLQSFVLSRLHELDRGGVSDSDLNAARLAIENLAGRGLRKAAAAAGLGESTLLLTKVLTNRITDVPTRVVTELARHLNVLSEAFQRTVGANVAGALSYKASDKPTAPTVETWEGAVSSLPVSEEEKKRLLALQD